MNILIFALLSTLEVIRHWYVIQKQHRSPNKLLSYLLRATVASLLIIWDDKPYAVSVPTFTILDWFLHDYLLNLLRGIKPIWYLNNSGPIDKFQREYPNAFVWFVWKTILFVGFLGSYFFN